MTEESNPSIRGAALLQKAAAKYRSKDIVERRGAMYLGLVAVQDMLLAAGCSRDELKMFGELEGELRGLDDGRRSALFAPYKPMKGRPPLATTVEAGRNYAVRATRIKEDLGVPPMEAIKQVADDLSEALGRNVSVASLRGWRKADKDLKNKVASREAEIEIAALQASMRSLSTDAKERAAEELADLERRRDLHRDRERTRDDLSSTVRNRAKENSEAAYNAAIGAAADYLRLGE